MENRKILLLGGTGQVGWELVRTLAPLGDVIVAQRQAGTHAQVDLVNAGALENLLNREGPALIVNAAAYTAVDKAESEQELTFRLNRDVPAELGRWALRNNAAVLHYSTDYVFDGRKTEPYTEDDRTAPLNVYGRSKLEGEAGLLASGARCVVLRVAWVYGLRGGNFLLTMQRLMQEREELRVVDDQFGAPTWSRMIAEASAHVAALMRSSRHDDILSGIYHLAPAGTASWFDFACAIRDLGGFDCNVVPIPSSEYPTPARRPANSRLDSCRLLRTFGVSLPHWRACLETALS